MPEIKGNTGVPPCSLIIFLILRPSHQHINILSRTSPTRNETKLHKSSVSHFSPATARFLYSPSPQPFTAKYSNECILHTWCSLFSPPFLQIQSFTPPLHWTHPYRSHQSSPSVRPSSHPKDLPLLNSSVAIWHRGSLCPETLSLPDCGIWLSMIFPLLIPSNFSISKCWRFPGFFICVHASGDPTQSHILNTNLCWWSQKHIPAPTVPLNVYILTLNLLFHMTIYQQTQTRYV